MLRIGGGLRGARQQRLAAGLRRRRRRLRARRRATAAAANGAHARHAPSEAVRAEDEAEHDVGLAVARNDAAAGDAAHKRPLRRVGSDRRAEEDDVVDER